MRNIHERVTDIDAVKGALFDILDFLPFGVVLVGSGCEVWQMNEHAEEIVSLDDGVWIDHQTLRAHSHSETKHLHALVNWMVDPERGTLTAGENVFALSRPSLLPSFSAMVAPINSRDEDFGEPFAAIFLSDPNRQNDFDPVRLERFYGLTPAEAKLTILLVQGLSLDKAAEKLNVSLNTVRTHLKGIFTKTGANRQSEVVRIILSGVIGFFGGWGPPRSSAGTIRNGELSVNLDTEMVMLEERQIYFTSREYSILQLLALRKGSTVPKDMIMSHLYGGVDERQIKTVDVFVCNLRKKLSNATGVNYIETVWGRGYRMPNLEEDKLRT